MTKEERLRGNQPYNPAMGLARSLERRLERLMDGISAAVFRGRMHPVDLANRLVRQADLLVVDGPAGPEIPNRFNVQVNPGDIADDIDASRLTEELNRALYETAADRGWQIGGPIEVRLTADPSVGKGSIKCSARHDPRPQCRFRRRARRQVLQSRRANRGSVSASYRNRRWRRRFGL